MNTLISRRDFGRTAAAAAAALVARPAFAAEASAPKRPPVHFFSKHLQFLDYEEMAAAAAGIGFDGLDLAVRPGGHVEPARVREDLPRAAAAMRAHGLAPLMITTAVTDAAGAHARELLETAAGEGVRFYRLGWFRFPEAKPWRAGLDECRVRLDGLAVLNERLGLHGAYQNHAGAYVGAMISDLAYLMEGFDPRRIGIHYDIRHATVEGGLVWPTGLRLVRDHVLTIALKDFVWEQGRGEARVRNVPLGEGVVDFKRYFKLLRDLGIDPVVSLHAEYDLGGADRGARTITIPREQVFDAYRKDLATFRRLWDDRV